HLARGTPQRRDPRRPAGVSSHDRAVARGSACQGPQGGQTRPQPHPTGGPARREGGHRRPKWANLAGTHTLREYVQDRLAGRVTAPDGTAVPGPEVRWIGRRHGRRTDRRWARSWSPEQIAYRLRVDFPDDGSMRISHEAIYQALYVQGRGALRRELTACLRTGRALRVPR